MRKGGNQTGDVVERVPAGTTIESHPVEKRPGSPSGRGGLDQRARPGFLIAVILLGVLCLGVSVACLLKKRSAPPGPGAPSAMMSAESTVAESVAAETELAPIGASVPPQPSSVRPLAGHSGLPAAPASVPEPGAYARELVSALCRLDGTNGPLPPEKAAAWKQHWQALLQQGGAAVPAIQEFLASNTNLNFGPGADQVLGYGSVRAALIGALAEIGGPEALAATLQLLQQTTDPRELATLAQNLDKLAPDQFRAQAVQSARDMLNTAGAAGLSDNDLAPVFEVLQRYGGASALSDLERAAGQWKYYSAIALAQLPDGAGIPSLVQMAQGQEGSTTGMEDPAVRMLAQLAPQDPAARDALLEQARQNRILPVTWAAMVPILAGDQVGFQYSGFEATATPANKEDLKTTHLASGNQNFYSAPPSAGLTPDQVAQRFDLIQKLLAVTADPAALQALKSAGDLLMKRSSAAAATPSPGQ